MKYLALGDSYTIGERVDAKLRWPVQLADLLRGQRMDVGQPTIIARTGWTTDELSNAIDAARPTGPYNLVSLLIGVNNQYRGRSVEEYREQFVFLLNRAVGFAGGRPERVLVLSIPDWGVTPYAEGRDRAGIGAQIDQFNAVAAEAAARAGAMYVDVTPNSRLAAEDATLIAKDGLHPSGAMYAAWAALALPAACRALTGT